MSYCYLASYLDYLSVLRRVPVRLWNFFDGQRRNSITELTPLLTHVNDDAFGLTKGSFNNYVDKKRGVGGLRDKGR